MKAITSDAALALLPDGDAIHTFTHNFMGADWDRASVERAIREATDIRLSDGLMAALNHPLFVVTHVGPRFIATKDGAA